MIEDKKKQAVDIGIITIKPEEYTAVIHRLDKWKQIDTGKHFYVCQSIKTADGRSLSVAVARSLDQGNSAAQTLASDMIAELSPKCLLLAGIAGGVPASEYSLGDVLLCTRLYDFSVCCSLEDQPSEFDVKSIPVHSHARNWTLDKINGANHISHIE
ncbi:MAG: 5'-methylthioadenosine/S-adenosylhomocysteine nucleosidase [Gammaproteobacteria bacterium]|nr:5'-methylthioadenosine/S-adenosylhomocysteine nucleosidase [Gammaproteobacteria bacterium]